MKRRAQRWSPVDEILNTVLKRVVTPQELAGYSVWTFWDDEVGEAIAQRAQPSHFRDGVLVVTVATHSWIQELQFMKESIRDKLNARLERPVIRDIYFASGKVASGVKTGPPPAKLPKGRAIIEMPAIADAAVRDAFTSLLEARARRLKAGSKRPK